MVKVTVVSLAGAAAAVAAGSISELPADMLKVMDETVDPCTDFFKYSCGTWFKNAVIPPTKSRAVYMDDIVIAEAERIVNELITSNKPKIGEFYQSCMDTATINKLGLTPLDKELTMIRTANSSDAILQAAAKLSSRGVHIFVESYVDASVNQASQFALYAGQTNLPLDQSYYTDADKWAKIQPAYREYIATLLKLAGKSEDEAKAAVDEIIAFEAKYADVQLTKVARKEALLAYYNPMSFAQANAKYPLTIGLQLQANGFNVRQGCSTDEIILQDLDFFKRVESLAKTTSVKTLQAVSEYRLLHAFAADLSADFATASWNLFGKTLAGQKEQPSRERKCRDSLDSTLGELVGKYYVDQVWPTASADRADAMVIALEAAFKAGLDTSDWLDDETRKNAKLKLSKFLHLLGGPKNPQTYPDITFDKAKFVDNRLQVIATDVKTNLARYNQPLDKQLWAMGAQEVNAYYSPTENKIVFPAAQLQSPYFDASFDAARNFGAIGAVIGHEITHGFDDEGRNFDGDGNMNPWWTDETSAKFVNKSQCIVDQYGSMKVVSDFTGEVLGQVDGKLTLGETIADNGGLKSAFRAYKEYIKTSPSDYTTETGEKMFFISFAHSWCYKQTDESLRAAMLDVHPPPKYRIVGAVQNNDDFARVFKCPANTAMNPAKKCYLWE
ncbi:hypothetical protein AC1031_006319 [Aphanomyces cochlioides]|nr:hypothetical protein AC1031_006319 [Aphanomyces cochlioides]